MRWWVRFLDLFIGAMVAAFLLIGYSVIHLHDAALWASPQRRHGVRGRRCPAKRRSSVQRPVYTP